MTVKELRELLATLDPNQPIPASTGKRLGSLVNASPPNTADEALAQLVALSNDEQTVSESTAYRVRSLAGGASRKARAPKQSSSAFTTGASLEEKIAEARQAQPAQVNVGPVKPEEVLQPSNAKHLTPMMTADPALPTYLRSLIPATEQLTKYVPRKMSGYTDVELVAGALVRGKNVLLAGDAGMGKNHLANAVAAYLQRPIFWINLNGGTTVEDLIGTPTVPTPKNGYKEWQDGVATLLVRFGGILGLDEINACPAEIAFALHQITDWRRQLTLPQKNGYEVVPAHANFGVIAAMNPEYRGTKPLNEAFRERFSIPLVMDYDNDVEVKLIFDKRLLKMAAHLRKSYKATEISSPCSTRLLLDFQENARLFGEGVARQFLLGRFDAFDRPAVAEAIKLHLDAATSKPADVKPLPFVNRQDSSRGSFTPEQLADIRAGAPAWCCQQKCQAEATVLWDHAGSWYAWCQEHMDRGLNESGWSGTGSPMPSVKAKVRA